MADKRRQIKTENRITIRFPHTDKTSLRAIRAAAKREYLTPSSWCRIQILRAIHAPEETGTAA